MGQEPRDIEDARASAASRADARDPAQAVRRLEERAEAIRGNLDVLVDEVERRGTRLAKPIAVGVGVAALGALVVAGTAAWRVYRRPPPSRLRGLARAMRRMAEHPERVAEVRPSVAKKVLASAGAALASIAVHQLVQVVSSLTARRRVSPSRGDAVDG